jgi:asparagine N-glycosylation enzyme membrane subunit Stt3
MKDYLIKVLCFLFGFIIFIVVEGVAYHDVEAANGTGSLDIIGFVVFVLWALIYGIISARKAKYNWAFIIGSTVAYVLASTSLQPILITVLVFSVCHSVFNKKAIKENLDQDEWANK